MDIQTDGRTDDATTTPVAKAGIADAFTAEID